MSKSNYDDLEEKLWTLATVVNRNQIDSIISLATWGFDFKSKLEEIENEHTNAVTEYLKKLDDEEKPPKYVVGGKTWEQTSGE